VQLLRRSVHTPADARRWPAPANPHPSAENNKCSEEPSCCRVWRRRPNAPQLQRW